VIDSEGNQIGIMQTRDAMELARSRGLDLVEISPTARPPVCKILDYGRFKYEQQKKTKLAKKKQLSTTMKEMRYRPKIDEHDYQFKTRHAIEFLQEGHKVKLYVEFRGREMAYKEHGARILERLKEDLADIATVENEPRMEGRTMSMVVAPKR
jgi:translation initiation factor IF-3